MFGITGPIEFRAANQFQVVRPYRRTEAHQIVTEHDGHYHSAWEPGCGWTTYAGFTPLLELENDGSGALEYWRLSFRLLSATKKLSHSEVELKREVECEQWTASLPDHIYIIFPGLTR